MSATGTGSWTLGGSHASDAPLSSTSAGRTSQVERRRFPHSRSLSTDVRTSAYPGWHTQFPLWQGLASGCDGSQIAIHDLTPGIARFAASGCACTSDPVRIRGAWACPVRCHRTLDERPEKTMAQEQEQFLDVVDRDTAERLWWQAIRPMPLGAETVPLAAALGRVLAAGSTPVAILPGFPTSAIFTFHEFVAPVLLQMAGLGPETRGEI